MLAFICTRYIPKFFFAATLIFIAVDLMMEWLVLVYDKIMPSEYFVLFFTFAAINIWGITNGFLSGILLSVVVFAWTYALAMSPKTSGQTKVWVDSNANDTTNETQALRRVMRRSNISRNIAQLDALQKQHSARAIVTIELSGFVFFGTAMSVLEDVKRYLPVPKKVHHLVDGEAWEVLT
jgi:SulP family sulfate permease